MLEAVVFNEGSVPVESPELSIILTPEDYRPPRSFHGHSIQITRGTSALAFSKAYDFDAEPTEADFIRLMFESILTPVPSIMQNSSGEFVLGFAFEGGGFYFATDRVREFFPMMDGQNILVGIAASGRGTKQFILSHAPTKIERHSWDDVWIVDPKGKRL